MKTCTCEAQGVQGTCVPNSLLVHGSAGMMILTVCVCMCCVHVCVCMCIVHVCVHVYVRVYTCAVCGGGCIYPMAGNFRGRNFRIPTLDRARGVRSRAGWPHPSIQRIARARFGWDHDPHLSWDQS